MDEKVKVIKLDTTYVRHFQLLLSWLNLATGHYQGDVVTLDKSTPQEQAPVAFFKLLVRIETPPSTSPPTPRAPPAGLFTSLSASWSRSLSSGGTSSLPGNFLKADNEDKADSADN